MLVNSKPSVSTLSKPACLRRQPARRRQRCACFSLPDAALHGSQQRGVPSRSGAEVRAAQESSIGAAISGGHDAAVFEPTVYEQDVEASVDTAPESAVVDGPKSVRQSMADILALSIPALGSTLADPLCSLADTALVGQVSSLQLAALSPCTAIFNLAFLVFQFVGVTITNKLASNSPDTVGLSQAEQSARQEENMRLVSYSITFAVIAGLTTCGVLLSFGPQILAAMGTNSTMMAPALSYLTFRALAAPSVLLMNVCQGICLGQQNSVTPLAVFASVGALNVILDVWFILGQGMGCGGAAIATAIAQWAGAVFFLRHLHQKGREGTSVPIKWMGLPTAASLQPFIGMASVLLSRTVFSMAAFTIITGAATSRGTVAAASHQVCLQLFWFLSYFPEPLSVAAQSLIARARACRAAAIQLTRCILGLAAGLGIAISSACAGSFYFGASLFTTDPAVAFGMQALAPPAFSALILCALAMACDGVSIGTDDYQHLPVVNFAGLAATAAYLHWCNVTGGGLAEVWLGMVIVFAVRLSVHALHHLVIHARTSAIAEALGWRQRGKVLRLDSSAMPAQPAAAAAT